MLGQVEYHNGMDTGQSVTSPALATAVDDDDDRGRRWLCHGWTVVWVDGW